MHAIDIIEATLAPLLLVSATGLLILGLGNRMGRVVDRLREFSREVRLGVDEGRKEVIMRQKGVLVRRAKLCRDAMIGFYFTILFSSLTSFFVFGAMLWSYMQYVALFFFVLSLVSLLAGAVISLYEISLSYNAILEESDVYLR